MMHHSLTHPGIALLHAHLEGVIATTSANAYWKDREGNYLGGNDWQVIRSGAESHDNLLRATDKDLAWKKYADTLMQHDRQVILTQQTSIFVEPVSISTDSKKILSHYLSCKSPLLNKRGKVIGLFGLSYLLNHDMSDHKIVHEIGIIAGTEGMSLTKKKIAKFRRSSLNLSERQIECLIHLIKGQTIRKIAENMSLSPRTVEHYIEAIKIKLKCQTRADLIEKMMDLGLIEIGI